MQVMGSMPVHHAITLVQADPDQSTATRSATALAGGWMVGGPVGGADEPVPGTVKEPVRLVIEFHRDMAATVQISVSASRVTNCECAAILALVHHVKSDRLAAVGQICRIT